MLTQELVTNLFSYTESGDLIWKKRGKSRKFGVVAGYIRKDGYKLTRINTKPYLIHRLIFLYHHGYLPKYIDHIDRNPANNRIENLREATHSQNHGNITKQSNNTSGYKGVSWNKGHKRWVVTFRGKLLGRFTDVILAAEAYDKAAFEYYGEFSRLNFNNKGEVK
jgi:hypothetical protein